MSRDNIGIQIKHFIMTLFITAKFFITSVVFEQIYQFSLNLNSLQKKFSLTLNYLGTNTVVVKKVAVSLNFKGSCKQSF